MIYKKGTNETESRKRKEETEWRFKKVKREINKKKTQRRTEQSTSPLFIIILADFLFNNDLDFISKTFELELTFTWLTEVLATCKHFSFE